MRGGAKHFGLAKLVDAAIVQAAIFSADGHVAMDKLDICKLELPREVQPTGFNIECDEFHKQGSVGSYRDGQICKRAKNGTLAEVEGGGEVGEVLGAGCRGGARVERVDIGTMLEELPNGIAHLTAISEHVTLVEDEERGSVVPTEKGFDLVHAPLDVELRIAREDDASARFARDLQSQKFGRGVVFQTHVCRDPHD